MKKTMKISLKVFEQLLKI